MPELPIEMPADVLAWLLDSDPALRWQVERDLLGAPDPTWQATRARVAVEGFGARLLALQDVGTGLWDGGAFFPADFDVAAMETEGQPWTATTWSLNDLREWGVDAEVLRARRTAELIAANARWEYEDLPYWDGEVDVCINAWTLANGAWLGVDVAGLAAWFGEHQLADGGWNCEWVEGSTRSSFHSTLNACRGLLAHEQATGAAAGPRRAGEEYLLVRRLDRRLSTGGVVGSWAHRFRYPQRWMYSVLGALDHFRVAAAHDGVALDPRLADAVEIVRAAGGPDGRWLQGERLPGRTWFDVDVPEGEPSKWLTLAAWRVLTWWAGGRFR